MTHASVPAPSSRCRPLRVERDDVLWFVTCRTVEERFWLHPLVSAGLEPPTGSAKKELLRLERHADRRIASMVRSANARKRKFAPLMDAGSVKRIARGLIGSALARAQELYDVEVFAFVALSNHVHLVCRAAQKNLAAFMGYFKARTADSVNRITGRRGPLWMRRYDAEPILDDDAAAALTAYTVRNPVKANLVDHYDEWPGLNLVYGLADSDAFDFEYLNCTAWHQARRPKDLDPFFEAATLTLSPLPHCADLSREVYRRMLQSWMEEAEAEEDAPMRRALGVKAVVKAPFDTRPENPSFRRRPYAFGSAAAKAKERVMMHMLARDHAAASQRWRSGDHDVPFPPGTYRPPLVRAA